MVLVLALIAAVASPPPVKAVESARVSIRVVRPHRASAETWNPAARSDQREVIKQEPDGTRQRLLLTEFE